MNEGISMLPALVEITLAVLNIVQLILLVVLKRRLDIARDVIHRWRMYENHKI